MTNIKFLISILCMAVFFVSCSEDNSNTGGDNNQPNDTIPQPNDSLAVRHIENDVENHTTWYSDTTYIIKDYNFYVEASLTIEAGTIIKFDNDEGPDMIVGDGGTIIAKGTSDKPIVFTSIKDDEHGGDHNGDDTATSPNKADWGHIELNDHNGSIFQYCHFYYGGSSSYKNTLSAYGANNEISHCVFAHNVGDGMYGALDASSAGEGTVIKNNIFYDNTVPFSSSVSFDIDNSNVFHDPDNPSVTNEENCIYIYAVDDIYKTITWSETEVAYVIDDNDFWVETGKVLQLADDVCLKFTSNSTLLLADGTSSIGNRNGNGVCFTSIKDDSKKGDTNGDGDATSPNDGDWDGIYDDTMSIPSPYYFNWGNIFFDSY